MNAEKKNFYGWILLVAIGIMFLCSSGFILVGASVVNPLMMADSSMNMNATLIMLINATLNFLLKRDKSNG